jgi:hypothetical protein
MACLKLVTSGIAKHDEVSTDGGGSSTTVGGQEDGSE